MCLAKESFSAKQSSLSSALTKCNRGMLFHFLKRHERILPAGTVASLVIGKVPAVSNPACSVDSFLPGLLLALVVASLAGQEKSFR